MTNDFNFDFDGESRKVLDDGLYVAERTGITLEPDSFGNQQFVLAYSVEVPSDKGTFKKLLRQYVKFNQYTFSPNEPIREMLEKCSKFTFFKSQYDLTPDQFKDGNFLAGFFQTTLPQKVELLVSCEVNKKDKSSKHNKVKVKRFL